MSGHPKHLPADERRAATVEAVVDLAAEQNPNINYYGIVILLRKLRECGIFTEKELRKIAARIAADNGVEVMFFL